MIKYFTPHARDETYIVEFNRKKDDYALYVRGHRHNSFGTPLAARGTFADIQAFRVICGMTDLERARLRETLGD